MCGYCGRRLRPTGRGDYACPRCAPLLAELGAGLPWGAVVAAYRRFVAEAARSSDPEQLALPLAPSSNRG